MSKFHRQHRVSRIDPAAKHGFPGFDRICAPYAAIERQITGDHRRHEFLDRPRDAPWRTATIAAFFSWVAIVFLAGSQDQIALHFHFSYVGLVWGFRIASIVVPFIVFFITRRAARELKETELHPLRGWTGSIVREPRGR